MDRPNYKENVDKARNANFRFGDGQTQQIQTCNQQNYNYKGEAAQIRSFLDEDTKKDLRAGHFKLGSHNNEYSTTAGRNH